MRAASKFRTHRGVRVALAVGVLALSVGAAPFAAASSLDHFGPRVGLSVDPDQFVLGGQLVISDVAKDITIDPSAELGFGDDATVIALNLDGKYHARIEDSDWRPYAGAGLGVVFASVDVPGSNQSSTEVGGNVVLGAGVPTKSGAEFFTELRFGLGDIPLMKLMLGWNFKLR